MGHFPHRFQKDAMVSHQNTYLSKSDMGSSILVMISL